MKILISVSLWLVASACFFVSCHKEQSVPQLAWGKYYVWSDPDSACQVLRSIAFPEKLSPEDYARYALLTVQATCRSGRTLPPDSLVEAACIYNKVYGSADDKALACFYKGYVYENQGKEEEALLNYKQAEEASASGDDRRTRFLIYTALGNLMARHSGYESAIGYFRKALDLKLSLQAWNEVKADWILIPPSMQVKGSDAYREEKRLMYETLSDVIERMDFASQEKIYYRSALKAMDDYRWPEATGFLLLAMDRTVTKEDRHPYELTLAEVCLQTGNRVRADSLLREVAKSSFPFMRAKAFRKMAETLQAEGKTAEALLQMQHYAEAMELTVTSDTRADLLEIEKRYDCSALERQNDAFRNRWALTVLLTVAVLSSLALLVFLGWSFFRKQRMELLKRSRHEVACLQQQIDSLQEQIDDNQGEARTFQEKLMALEAEKKSKEIRIRQLETTFRSKHISLSVEAIEAAQVYLQVVSRKTPAYHPSSDRSALEHWMNLSLDCWAERLAIRYPSLTNGEKDICYLCRLGLGFDEMALLLGVQSRSVERTVYRICRKMGLTQGSKEEFRSRIFMVN